MRYYKRTDNFGNTTTVESYSHSLPVEGAIEISKTEFDDFRSSLPVPNPIPFRDLEAEIDALSKRITGLEPIRKPVDYQTNP